VLDSRVTGALRHFRPQPNRRSPGALETRLVVAKRMHYTSSFDAGLHRAVPYGQTSMAAVDVLASSKTAHQEEGFRRPGTETDPA